MKLSRTIVLLLVASALAFLSVACSSESQTVQIGLLSPQTGPIAQYAPGFEDAGNVAISELNAAQFTMENAGRVVRGEGADWIVKPV